MSVITEQFSTADKAARAAYAKEFAACKAAGMSETDANHWASDYAGDVFDSTLDYLQMLSRTPHTRIECRNTLNAAKA
jgi:hypothetical protein